MKRIAAVAVAALLAPLAGAQQLYKYVDQNGRTVYSDTPPANIESKQLTPSGVSGPVAKSAVERDKDLQKSRKEAAEKADKADKADKLAREQAARCQQARDNQRSVAEGGRLYKYNDKGEREFMGDEEIAAAQQRAQRDVDEACKKT
jgi:hypothetical protein